MHYLLELSSLANPDQNFCVSKLSKNSVLGVQMTRWTHTVRTINSCAECMGSPGVKHYRIPDCHPVSWAWKNGWRHNWTHFDLQATWVIDVFGLLDIWHIKHWCLYSQAVADVWSTGAGIKCLYCRCLGPWHQYKHTLIYNQCTIWTWSRVMGRVRILLKCDIFKLA